MSFDSCCYSIKETTFKWLWLFLQFDRSGRLVSCFVDTTNVLSKDLKTEPPNILTDVEFFM